MHTDIVTLGSVAALRSHAAPALARCFSSNVPSPTQTMGVCSDSRSHRDFLHVTN